MTLRLQLESMDRFETVHRLQEMLSSPDQIHITISWWGERLVSIEGYEGSVDIYQLAQKYLFAAPFRWRENPSIEDRLECYDFWPTIEALIHQSDVELRNTSFHWLLTPLKEGIPYFLPGPDSLAIIVKRSFYLPFWKNSLLQFNPEEFQTIWPLTPPESKGWAGGFEFWRASEEMMRAYEANHTDFSISLT